jgi:hypothetical protein
MRELNKLDDIDLDMQGYLFSKKLHPEFTFNKYKRGLVFRSDRWVDFFNNKTYSGTVRLETVRLLFNCRNGLRILKC